MERGMATHSSIIACGIPSTWEHGRLLSLGSQRFGHGWANNTFTSNFKLSENSFRACEGNWIQPNSWNNASRGKKIIWHSRGISANQIVSNQHLEDIKSGFPLHVSILRTQLLFSTTQLLSKNKPIIASSVVYTKNLSRFSSLLLQKPIQWCLTLCNPMDYSLSVSSVHGILQARIL